jgi:hypothetical protein
LIAIRVRGDSATKAQLLLKTEYIVRLEIGCQQFATKAAGTPIVQLHHSGDRLVFNSQQEQELVRGIGPLIEQRPRCDAGQLADAAQD